MSLAEEVSNPWLCIFFTNLIKLDMDLQDSLIMGSSYSLTRDPLLNMLQIKRKSQVLSFLFSAYKTSYYIDFE